MRFRKFEKLVNKINKGGYDVSIGKCLIEDSKIEYEPGYDKDNGLYIYAWNKEVIEKIKKIADNMKHRTIFQEPNSPLKCYEVFVY